MDTSDPVIKGFLNAIMLIVIIYIVAIPFYMHFEGFSLVDAIYFTSVSITTVGYGDVYPKTVIGKLFTVGLVFSGVSIFFYHITHIGQFRERKIDPYVRRRIEVLRNLTSLHTGVVAKSEINKIRSKIEMSEPPKEEKTAAVKQRGEKRDDKPRDFGSL